MIKPGTGLTVKGNIAIDGKLTFCGGIDVAALLAKHTEEVAKHKEEVRTVGVAFYYFNE